MEICRSITAADLEPYASLPTSAFYKQVASLLDKRICTGYKLFPNNYIAHDLLHGNDSFAEFYTENEKEAFIRSMNRLEECSAQGDLERIREIYLGIYANPVDSRVFFEGK